MEEMGKASANLIDGKTPGAIEFLLKYGSTKETICSINYTN